MNFKTQISNPLNSTKVILIGPSPEPEITKSFLTKKRDSGHVIISFSSSSLIFLHDIGFTPDFHSFIDPQSYCHIVKKIGLSFLKKINFLGYKILTLNDLFATNLKVWKKKNAGISNFLENKKYVETYKSPSPLKSYNNCLHMDAVVIQAKDSFKKNIDLKSNLYRFMNGTKEVDKLTYILIPIILFWFKDLETLSVTGFGYFDKQRYFGGNKSSYTAYKAAYKNILPFYREMLARLNINISINKSSYFSELSRIKKKFKKIKPTPPKKRELNKTKPLKAFKANSNTDPINILNFSKILLISDFLDKNLNNKYFESKRKDGYLIISSSASSLIALREISFVPDFYAPIDLQCYCSSLIGVSADYLNQINFLGYESPHLSTLNTNPLNKLSYISTYESNPPFEFYKKCFIKNPTLILNNQKSQIYQDIRFKENLYLFTNGSCKIEKLTYSLLPMILYWFKNLSQLDLIGSGLFDYPPHDSDNQNITKSYKEAYDKILYIYRSTNFSPKIKVSIQSRSYFYNLKNLLSNNQKNKL